MKLTRYSKSAVLLPPVFCLFLVFGVHADTGQGGVSSQDRSPQVAAGVEPGPLRDQAVIYARAGDYPLAIKLLERLLALDVGNTDAYHDLIIVLGWAEQDQQALQLARDLDPGKVPVDVLESLAKSARNVADFAQSTRWYKRALTQSPARLESHLGLALALADAGQPDEALRSLQAIGQSEQNGLRVLMTKAYIHHSGADYASAIAVYDSILVKNNNHRDALRGKIFSMQRLFLPAQAIALAGAHPGTLTEYELAQLNADWAAVQIRWANQGASNPAQATDELDAALQTISETQQRSSPEVAVQRRAAFDRVVALRSQLRMAESVAEYEQLAAATEQIPAYVLGAAAGAYLHLRQPAEAQELLLRALQLDPDSFSLQQDQVYLYVDLEQHDAAMALAESLRQDEPVWLQVPGSRIIKSNPRRLQAEITAGLSLSFADQLVLAQIRFEELLERAPHNTSLRHELATVYRRRGWPDRALFEYDQVVSIEPGLTAAAVGHAHTLLDQRQYKMAEQDIGSLVAVAGHRQDVTQLGQRWGLINKHEYRIDTRVGKSSGDQFGSQQYNIDAHFYLKPLAYRWRAFVRSADAFAEFPDGDVSRRRLGTGIEYRGADWVSSVELNGDRKGGGDLGVHTRVQWFASDTWSLGALWETQSDAVPLRGYRLGLDADRIGLSLDYRASELRQLSLSSTETNISDGNTRHSWSLRARQRLVTRPAYKFDLAAEVVTSRANAQDVVYFNPRRDTLLRLTASNDWRTYRRYDYAFTQQVNVGYGHYWQDAHGSSPVGSLEYLVNIDFDASLRLNFGLRFARDVFDGDAENATFFTAGIAGVF